MKNLIQKLKSSFKSSSKSEHTLDEEHHDWYMPTMTREETQTFLSNKQIGVFIVRKSESQGNCLVLSIKVARFLNVNEVSHYIIQQTRGSFKLKGFVKEFPDLSALVTHCSVIRDMLPVLLNLKYYSHGLVCFEQDDRSRKEDNYMFYNSSTSSLVSRSSLNSFNLDVSY